MEIVFKKMNKTDIIICKCYSAEHQFIFRYFEDEKYPEVYITTHLSKFSFWKRVKYAIKYIFGYQSKYGAFDEFLVNPQDANKLQEVVNYLKNPKQYEQTK